MDPLSAFRFSGGHDLHQRSPHRPRHRRHRQDRSPCRRPAAAAGHTVRIGSRTGAPPFDWHDPATWPAALEGVDAAYLAYAPDVAFPGAAEPSAPSPAPPSTRGVGRLVLLSGRGEAGARRAEDLVRRGRRVDDRARRRVRPELHRGGVRRAGDRRCRGAARRRRRRAVRRCRRHRRHRGRRARRRPPRRPAVRGDGSPAAHVRRGAGDDRGRDRAARRLRAARRRPSSVRARRRRRAGRRRGEPRGAVQRRSSTGATARSPTACSGRSAGRPATSAPSSRRPRRAWDIGRVA